MKFYIEIINPANAEVLWHYYINAPSIEEAKEFASNKFIEEHSDDILLDTGGAFMLTAEEEK
ncbi:MAG TPA: hypothetical protein VK808_11590 [Bacteroidia bacterium]|jgi:hypothetical protein|nr:hypothetical protein [Bacteroidia bacterium]